MKKIFSLCAGLMLAGMMTAQIAVWNTVETQTTYDNGLTWRDTTLANVVYYFNYNEVDNITVANKYLQGLTTPVMLFWKDGKRVSLNGTNYEIPLPTEAYIEHRKSHTTLPAPVDSIVWHPYALRDIYISRADTLPVATVYGSTTYSFPMYPAPQYATFDYQIAVSDPTVVQAEIRENSYNQSVTGIGYYRMWLNITPLKKGKTTITITFDNAWSRSFDLVIGDAQTIEDETTLSVDSIFNKIYNRTFITGDMLPSGKGDLRNIDEGTSSFYRMMYELQELGADHLFWIWNDPGISDLQENTVTADNYMVHGLFRRLYYNIWLCNSYLNRTEGQTALATERAEVRFMRAYYYYYLLDMFGNVPVIERNVAFTTTAQSTRAEVFNFVEAELLAAESDLAAVGQKANYYRVDKAAAWLLLSRLYLNSGVYTGTTQYDKAAQYAYRVMQSSYELATEYKWLFMGDNDMRSTVNDAYNEIIFAARHEGQSTASYGGSLFPIAAMSENSMMPSNGLNTSWQCLISRSALPLLFFSNPASAAQGTADEVTAGANDDRALFCNSYNGNTWSWSTGTPRYSNFQSGWAIQKWNNNTADPNYVKSSESWPDTDLPLLRKAEAYLNYAEAVLRGGQEQHNVHAAAAVNALRNRAHASTVTNPTLNYILDERGREFYAEGHRRSDLIRYGQYNGKTLFPIPQDLLPLIPNGQQNPGY